jgi:hypothetical protein
MRDGWQLLLHTPSLTLGLLSGWRGRLLGLHRQVGSLSHGIGVCHIVVQQSESIRHGGHFAPLSS